MKGKLVRTKYPADIRLTIHDIFKIYGINPLQVLLVRHGNKHFQILETFSRNLPRLEAYQSCQEAGKFRDAKSIAVFAPYHGTTALFLGLWDIHGFTKFSERSQEMLSLIQKYQLPEFRPKDVWYNLHKNPVLDDLSERMIIQWGGSVVSFVQSKNKEVIEVLPKGYVREFPGWLNFTLGYDDLRRIVEHPDANREWHRALSHVAGIYLILDEKTGKQYVGAAYGAGGVIGRWKQYARSADGGNSKLKELLATDINYGRNNFKFSLLSILPTTATKTEAIDLEEQFKQKLGARAFGLCGN